MKNLLKTLAVTATLVGMSGGVALADSSCTISNTGPDSNNTCTSEETNVTHVSCVNGIYVVNDNDQEAGSGDAENEGNTSGGNATSGSAVNENGTTVQIGTSCGGATTTPETETPSTGGGAGAGNVLGEATAGHVLGDVAQVSFKPVGGAGAGAGGATDNAAAVTGLLASASAGIAGLALRKNALGRN